MIYHKTKPTNQQNRYVHIYISYIHMGIHICITHTHTHIYIHNTHTHITHTHIYITHTHTQHTHTYIHNTHTPYTPPHIYVCTNGLMVILKSNFKAICLFSGEWSFTMWQISKKSSVNQRWTRIATYYWLGLQLSSSESHLLIIYLTLALYP